MAKAKQNREVVYNACYGGFSISVNMARYILERTEDEEVKKELQEAIDYSLRSNFMTDSVYIYYGPKIDRHDPLLVEAVKKFPDECKVDCRNLQIEAIGDSKYIINEYDGYESVVTQEHDFGWK